jgi:hypothetical protein
MTNLEAALDYLKEGFRVFPVKLDKTPYTQHGLKDATQLQVAVKEYWAWWPNAGIGLVTDGMVVLDFDKKSGGAESYKAMVAKFGALPKTRTHRTGGGGLHYIYRNPNGSNIRNTAGLAGYAGVDLRANGGYIVAPPSKHISGKCYEVFDPAPIIPAPSWLVDLIKQQRGTSLAIPSDGEPIPEGHRNATLASMAGSMRRKGMTSEEIEAALLVINRRCNPPLDPKAVSRIASSVARYQPNDSIMSSNVSRMSDLTVTGSDASIELLEKSVESVESVDGVEKVLKSVEIDKSNVINAAAYTKLARQVDQWLTLHAGETFDLDIICRQMGIANAVARNYVTRKLSYELKHERVDKHNRLYTAIIRSEKKIDWTNALTTDLFPIKWPYAVDPDDESTFGFDGHVDISPGDIIVLAGVSNMGKTAWCLNLLWENMDTHACTLMGNEYTPGKFKRRVAKMDWKNPLLEDGTPKFELIEKREGWKYAIRPDNINIIDWINLNDCFYQIGSIIEGIQSKLRKGIAVICLQKDSSKALGLGGGFSEHLASLYLAIDFERCTVRKAKEWHGKNPNGKMYGFKIYDGVKFGHIHEVKLCFKCKGTGIIMGSQCGICLGQGSVDI